MKQAFVSSADQGGGKRRAISQARSTVSRSSAATPPIGQRLGSGGPRSASLKALQGEMTNGTARV